MADVISGTGDRSQDRPGTAAPVPAGTAGTGPGTTGTHPAGDPWPVPAQGPGTGQDRAPVPAGTPGPVPAGTTPGPATVPDTLTSQDRPGPVPGTDPDDQSRDPDAGTPGTAGTGTPVLPVDPWWLTWSIGGGFLALTVASLVLASDGQAAAAGRAGVGEYLRWFSPGVLELVSGLLVMLGYRRGRHGGSPWGYWTLATGVAGYAVLLTTQSAPTTGAKLLFGGASAVLVLLTFLKFSEDLTRYQRDVLKRRPSRPPAFGILWLIRPRLARRAWLIAGEFDITVLATAKNLARTWCVVYDDTGDFLAGVPALIAQDRDPAAPGTPVPAAGSRWRRRKLARRAADAAVAAAAGQPFHIPREVEIATVAMRSRPTPPVPGPGPVPDLPAGTDGPGPGGWPPLGLPAGWDPTTVPAVGPGTPAGDPGTGAPVPVSPAPAGSPPVPAAGPGTGPGTGPRVPAGPGSGLTVAEMLDMIGPDAIAAAIAKSPTWDPAADLARLDELMPGWHTGDCPTKNAIAAAMERGNTVASSLRQFVDTIRRTRAARMAEKGV